MKFLFFTDDHKRGNSPANRKDNFPQTLKNKLLEISRLIRELEVDYVLHGGDFFDNPAPAPHVCAEFLTIFQNFGVPIFAVSGNHDVYGHNPATIERTMLGLMDKLGIIKLLQGTEPVYLEKNGIRVQLTGTGYHWDLDSGEKSGYIIKKKDADVAIHLVHGPLLDRSAWPGVSYTLIEDVLSTEADVTLAGHFHLGFPDTRHGNKYFLNPGALARLSNHPAEITRPVQVILIDLSSGRVNCRRITLSSAPPGNEVLDRTKTEEAAFREARLASFLKEVSQAGQFRRMDLRHLLTQIASANNLEPEVREEALRQVALAEEAVLKGSSE
ncbi:MAG: metallophosphoesterase family protein [Clostridia bacterium]|nr:metallophosphoesterase family protein [Clostridia bacterium]